MTRNYTIILLSLLKISFVFILSFIPVIALGVTNCVAELSKNQGHHTHENTHISNSFQRNPASWVFTPVSEDNVVKAVNALPCIVRYVMLKTGVPGIAVAVVRSDKALLVEGFGVREIGKRDLVDADTVFQLASLSKPIGATVISRAVSEGWISWSDPVKQYLPWFGIGDKTINQRVTLADLYSHRSGLPDHAGDKLEDLGYKRTEILHKLSMLPLGEFRVQYAYTNFGLTAAAEAVAHAKMTTWEKLSRDLLYEPAGMSSTSSNYYDYLTAANKAVTHQRRHGRWLPGFPRNAQAQSPAGGVSASIKDISLWMRLLLGNGALDGKQLIDSGIVQIMRQPHVISKPASLPSARSSFYGLGFNYQIDGLGHVRWSHSGAFLLGASTYFVMLPAGDIAIAVLANGEPHGIPEAISAAFMNIVETGTEQRDWLTAYQSLFASFYTNPSVLSGKQRPTVTRPAKPLSVYTGVYNNNYFGPAEINLDNGRLLMSLGPIPIEFTLKHWNEDVFFYFPAGENALGIAAVSFDMEANTMTVEDLNEHKLGLFVRNEHHE